MGSLGTIGGGEAGGATPPGLTVADRADGAAYTVPNGARSLTITNPDSATLLTTVRRSSDGAAVDVTNPNAVNPSWSVPAGGANGEGYQVRVRASAGGLTTSVAFTENVISDGLKDITLQEIDLTDGTWTLEDPDDLIDSTTFASGQNTITWNAASGSSDLNIASGSNFRGPRWYKLLSVSGQQATTAKPLVFVTRIEPDKSSGSDFNQRHVIGTSFDPDSTVTTTINGAGAAWQINENSQTVQMGAWTRQAVNLLNNSTNERQIMASLRGFESLGTPSFLNIRNTDVTVGTGARNSNQLAIGGAGADLYVMVALGTSTNTSAISAGDQTIFKAAFVASTYSGI